MNSIGDFKIGDVIKISQKIQEGKKERIVPFKGQLIRIKGSGSNRMITLRQNLEGIEVDRMFPVYSPTIIATELVAKPKKKVKKAKLLKKPVK